MFVFWCPRLHNQPHIGLRLARLRMLDKDGNPKHGFHHLGMHDVENITRCLVHLIENDAQLEVNGWWK